MRQKTAFLFPGQGAQFVGMGADFFGGRSGGIYDLMREGPAEELNKTQNAQEAIFLHSLAVAEEFKGRGIRPDCVAGFSLGEITALHFAGVFNCRELLKVRAEAMQRACEEKPGTMVAVVRISADKVKEICGGFKQVWPVNFNSPEQIVCSCALDEVDAFSQEIAKQGGRALRLKVSGAFHSLFMSGASEAVAEYLREVSLKSGEMPVYANLTARPYDDGDAKALVSGQINSPVLWQQTVENMLEDGVRTFIEVGPGAVLSGLVRKIVELKGVEGVKIFSVGDRAGVEAVLLEVRE